MGPAAPRPARPVRARNEPADPFAPPELAAEEPLLQLADEDVAHRARRQASVPPPVAGESARRSSLASPANPPASVQRGSGMAPDARRPPAPFGAVGAEPGHRTPPGPPAGARQSLPTVPPAPLAGMPQGPVAVPPALLAGMPQGPVAVPPAPLAGMPQGPVAVPSALLSGVPPALPIEGTPRRSAPAGSAAVTAFRRPGRELVARLPVLASGRVRLVAGVALAIVLGFLPAHVVGGIRERSAFGAIDARVVAVQAAADTPARYAALDAFRAEQLEAKYRARRSIAVTALLVWAVAGAALALGWFSLFRPPRAPGGAQD
jgi:hypothetical protein